LSQTIHGIIFKKAGSSSVALFETPPPYITGRTKTGSVPPIFHHISYQPTFFQVTNIEFVLTLAVRYVIRELWGDEEWGIGGPIDGGRPSRLGGAAKNTTASSGVSDAI